MFRKALKLSEEQRSVVESLLGRKLEADETVSIRASKGVVLKDAPTGRQREEALQRFIERADETAGKVERASDAEIETLIDEAASHVRRNRR